MTAPTRTYDVESLDYFVEASTSYQRAAARYSDRRLFAIDIRSNRDALRAKVEQMKADVIADGGFADVAVDGRNAETRDAQLTQALALHRYYQAAIAKLREADRAISRLDTEIDEASNDMRGARLRIEFVTSQNYRAAAAEGWAGTAERHNGHGN